MKNTFSVVIPLYNKRNTIIETLESVFAQTYTDFEIIVVDDGSTDDSVILIEKKFCDPRVKIIRQENGGVSKARNTGIMYAKNDYVVFLDGDDLWENDFLNIIDFLIKKYPDAGLYCTNYKYKISNNKYRKPKLKYVPRGEDALLNNYFNIGGSGDLVTSCSSCCIPKYVLNRVGGFPVGERLGEDQELWIRIAFEYQIAFSSKCAVTYRLDIDNRATIKNIPNSELPFSKRLQHKIDRNQVNKVMVYDVKKYIANHLIYVGQLNIRSGNYRLARSILSDKRCSLHRFRQIAWLIKSYIYQSLSFILPNRVS